jgi:hypothetical protein
MGNLTYTNWEIQVYGMHNVKTDSKMESEKLGKKKVKQSRYRPGVAQRVPGS